MDYSKLEGENFSCKCVRLAYLDNVKGIAIILLLLSHSIPNEGNLKTWIFSFHMPVFFVICGFIFNLKYASTAMTREKLHRHIKKRFRNLVLPYVVFGLILVVFYACLDFCGTGHVSSSRLVNLITLQGVDSLWFIPVYFFSELMFMLGSFGGGKSSMS